tara:strand:- start:5205 stop:5672 length:468 start_codon:yes stop_codon:yes gene_type:complete
MKNLLWLDDLRNPFLDQEKKVPEGKWNIIWVLDYEQFVMWIEKNGLPDAISFDHDLAPEHYTPAFFWSDYDASKKFQDWRITTYEYHTGEGCAMWLMSNFSRNSLPEIFVHSANPVGADKIRVVLGIATEEWFYCDCEGHALKKCDSQCSICKEN